jgi:hypothetical protein
MTAIAKIISAASLTLMAPMLIVGCGASSNLEGRWVGYRDLDPYAGSDPALMKSMAKVDLRISRERFDLSDLGLAKKGKVEVSGGRIFLNVTDVTMGNSQPEEHAAEIARDGANLVYQSPGRGPVELMPLPIQP